MSEAPALTLVVHAIGWAIWQSTWLGLLIGALTGMGLFVLRQHSPKHRYLLACLGMVVLAVVSVSAAITHDRQESLPIRTVTQTTSSRPEPLPAGPSSVRPLVSAFPGRLG